MRMLRAIELLSLDGVLQAPGAPDEDTEGGFRHGGWQRPYVDEVLGASAAEWMAATDSYLFGRKTYEKMAAHWPAAPEDDPYARHLNSTPKVRRPDGPMKRCLFNVYRPDGDPPPPTAREPWARRSRCRRCARPAYRCPAGAATFQTPLAAASRA